MSLSTWEITVTPKDGESFVIYGHDYEVDAAGLHVLHRINPVTRKHYPAHGILRVTAQQADE